MADIRIKDLPTNGTPSKTQFVPTDLASTEKLTIEDLVLTGRPSASQAEAEAGVEPTKAMTPLTTKQAIEAQAVAISAIGTTIQPYSTNLDTLAAITPLAAGTSMLAMALSSDVRNFLDTAAYVATRTAAKALDTTKDTTLILTEAGREGIFNWRAGDYSAQITADTLEGIYIKANAIASSAGAWVRVSDGSASIRWFGATGGTNDSVPIQACIDYLNGRASPYNGGVCYVPSGIWNANISLKARVFIQGDRPGASVIRMPDGANTHVLTVPLGFSMGGWDGITIDGNAGNNTAGCGIYFEPTGSGSGQSFSPFNGKVSQTDYSYKMLSGTNFIVGYCPDNGIEINGYCFDVRLLNWRTSHNGANGIQTNCTDGFFANGYSEKNGLSGIYGPLSGANKYVSIKSIFNGRQSNTVGSVAGVYILGQSNQLYGVEAQDNYCDGFYLGGVDSIWMLDSNRNGYKGFTMETESSRIHANYRFDATTRRCIFKGTSFTYATAVGTDGFWTTEYPYIINSGAVFSSFECDYEPGVFNAPPNTARVVLYGGALLDMGAFSVDGNVNTFFDMSPKGTTANTIRTGRTTPGSWTWNFYQPNTATVRHAIDGAGNTIFNADNAGNFIIGNSVTGGLFGGGHAQLGPNHIFIDASARPRFKPAAAPSSATDGFPLLRQVSVPGTATSTGAIGDFAFDASFLYTCHAANTWRRVAIASW